MRGRMMGNNSNSFKNLEPSDILVPSSVQPYEAGIELIWKELLRLNSNLFILEKLLNFPSDLIIGPDEPFFVLVNVALAENSMLVITKLVTDEGEEKGSILRFKNWVVNNTRDEYRNTLKDLLNKKKEDITALKKASGKIKLLRDYVIAHLIVDKKNNLKYSGNPKISFQELDSIRKRLNDLFDALCFSCEYPLLPAIYEFRAQQPAGTDSRSDIEYYLDLIIQDSYWYKRPDSQYWKLEREYLSQNELDLLNEYRKKFGQPEV